MGEETNSVIAAQNRFGKKKSKTPENTGTIDPEKGEHHGGTPKTETTTSPETAT